MSIEVIEVFDHGHEKGFVHGYQTALQDIRSALAGVTDKVPRDDTESVMARYHEIFRGLDDSSALEFIQEHMQEVTA